MFKAFHKLIAFPTAATSVGLTVYFIHKWTTSLEMLKIQHEDMPEVQEQPPEEASAPGAKSNDFNVGSSDKAPTKKAQGDHKDTQGNDGKQRESSSGEDVTTDLPQNQPAHPSGSSTPPQTPPTSTVSGIGGDSEHVNERSVENEIRKLIMKIIYEKEQWLSRPDSIKSSFELHEVMDIGNKLLEQLNKGTNKTDKQ